MILIIYIYYKIYIYNSNIFIYSVYIYEMIYLGKNIIIIIIISNNNNNNNIFPKIYHFIDIKVYI